VTPALLVPARPVSIEALTAFARAQGWEGWQLRPPGWEGSVLSVWGDDGGVALLQLPGHGVALLRCDGHDTVLEAVAEAYDTTDALALLEAPGADPIRAVGLASAVLQLGCPSEAARARMLDGLSSDDPLVRWFSGRRCRLRGDAGASTLADPVEHLERWIREQQPEARRDVLEVDPYTLAERALEAAAAGQLERARSAAEPLLEEEPDNAAGIYALGVALSHDEPLAAAFLLGAVSRVREGAHLRFPDASERVTALRERTAEAEAGPTCVDLVLRTVAAWRRYGRGDLAYQGSAGVCGRLRELEPLVVFLLGEGGDVEGVGDAALLEAAARAAPGVTRMASQHVEAVAAVDPAAADALMGELVARLRRGIEPTAVEARIEAALGAPVTLREVLGRWARAAYDAGEHDVAAARAEDGLMSFPHDPLLNEVRAMALTFSDRLAEACHAYTHALDAYDRHLDGGAMRSDPRPHLWFNRACCAARLGRREEALDDLRRAVTGDARFAARARTDDWLEGLWTDPELQAIVSQDPEALLAARGGDARVAGR
jgi:hypothetical protein